MERKEYLSKKRAKQIDILLDSLKQYPNISRAEAKAGLPRGFCANQAKANPDFANQFEEARRIGFQSLEDSILDRGFGKLEEGDSLKNYSDSMAMFYLKANLDKYKDKQAIDFKGKMEGEIDKNKLAAQVAMLLNKAKKRKEIDDII